MKKETEGSTETAELADNSSLPDEEAIAGEAKRKADLTLEAMPNKQRTAFLLRNHQGLSIPDIAKVMKTTEGTVRVYLHRAVAAQTEPDGICLGRMVMKEYSDTLRTACKDFEEDLVLYYYGDGSENERIRVQGHLQTCSSCREFLEDLAKIAAPNG